jgi:hypothetical protein
MLAPLFFLTLQVAQAAPPTPAVSPAKPEASSVDTQSLRQLLTLKRVFVDHFSGGETAAQMRDMIIASLENTKLFVITENQEKADAILRGSGEDLVYNDVHSSSEGLNVHSSMNTSDTDEDTALRGGTRTYERSGRGVGLGAGENESTHSVERRHEANAAVRLVSKDGDVIWSTTQESLGGKFRGASADVADKITRRLMEDFDRARKLVH